MHTKKVPRYYCDHCSRGGFHSVRIADHEKVCYLNPARVCDLCERVEAQQKPLADLFALFVVFGSYHPDEIADPLPADCDAVLAALEAATRGCPACMLAAAMTSHKAYGVFVDVGYADRKKALDARPITR